MSRKIIRSFNKLSFDEAACVAELSVTNGFGLEVDKADKELFPTGIYDVYLTNAFFKHIFNDQEAFFQIFSFCFRNGVDDTLKLPIGIFGVSPRNKLRFPFAIGDILIDFLKIGEDQISSLLGMGNGDGKERLRKNLYAVKKNLLHKIFFHFALLEDEYCAAMAWPLRNRGSLTRDIAESTGLYHRYENKFARTEYYYTKDTNIEEHLDLLETCFCRWIEISGVEGTANAINKDKAYMNNGHFLELLAHFCNKIVNTNL